MPIDKNDPGFQVSLIKQASKPKGFGAFVSLPLFLELGEFDLGGVFSEAKHQQHDQISGKPGCHAPIFAVLWCWVKRRYRGEI
jgi:hypothetical protein